MKGSKTLRNLRRRLERRELRHLREHVLELAGRLEEAESRAGEAERRAGDADEIIEYWRKHALDLQRALADDEFATHRCVGLSADGQLMVVRCDSKARE